MIDNLLEWVSNPLFGIVITIIAFQIGVFLNKKTGLVLFNPVLVSIVLIIIFLKVFKIEYALYNNGGKIITLLLGPATVALAIPLYRQVQILKEHFILIFIGVGSGCLASAISIFILSKIFGIDEHMYHTLLPKSITTTIGMGVAEEIGGSPVIVVPIIIITGILGTIICTSVFKIFKIKNSIALGLAIGTSAHAVGTSKAIEFGEIEGAMSSLAIVVAGIITVIIAPIAAVIF